MPATISTNPATSAPTHAEGDCHCPACRANRTASGAEQIARWNEFASRTTLGLTAARVASIGREALAEFMAARNTPPAEPICDFVRCTRCREWAEISTVTPDRGCILCRECVQSECEMREARAARTNGRTVGQR